MEADIYGDFRSSKKAQKEIKGIEGIRIWEHIFFSSRCNAHYNTEKASYKREHSWVRETNLPSPTPWLTQTLLGTEVWVGHKIKSELKGAPFLTSLCPCICRYLYTHRWYVSPTWPQSMHTSLMFLAQLQTYPISLKTRSL